MGSVLESIVPVFILILLGIFLRRGRFLPAGASNGFTWLVFYVTVPALLFRNIAISNPEKAFDIRLWSVIFIVSIIFAFAPLVFLVNTAPDRRGVIAQGIYRSNMVFVGLPILQNYIGGHPELMAVVSMVIAMTVPVYNLLAVVVLLIPLKDLEGGRIDLKKIARDVALNPLILGSLAGLLFSLSGLPLFGFMDRTLGLLGGISAPLALVSVGLSLDLSSARVEGFTSILVSLGKLIVYPAVIYGILKFLGTSDSIAFSVVILTGTPTAVVSYIMAVEMRGDGNLAASIIAVSTIISLITLTSWLFLWRWIDPIL